jgi:hypothetical protein
MGLQEKLSAHVIAGRVVAARKKHEFSCRRLATNQAQN